MNKKSKCASILSFYQILGINNSSIIIFTYERADNRFSCDVHIDYLQIFYLCGRITLMDDMNLDSEPSSDTIVTIRKALHHAFVAFLLYLDSTNLLRF